MRVGDAQELGGQGLIHLHLLFQPTQVQEGVLQAAHQLKDHFGQGWQRADGGQHNSHIQTV
jgi:hypothetical protein